jgi:hypothetical protein
MFFWKAETSFDCCGKDTHVSTGDEAIAWADERRQD